MFKLHVSLCQSADLLEGLLNHNCWPATIIIIIIIIIINQPTNKSNQLKPAQLNSESNPNHVTSNQMNNHRQSLITINPHQ